MSAIKLSSADKAAILLLTLGEELAAEVFKQLAPQEVRRIGSALARLGPVNQTTVDIVLNEFLGLLKTKKSVFEKDGVAFAQKAIALAFKSEEAKWLSDAIAQNQVQLRSLERIDAETLARILKNEHPQTIALVLAHAKADQGASLIQHFPESMKSELLVRLAQMDHVAPEVIAQLDHFLTQEIQRLGNQQHRKIGGPQQVAAILNRLDEDGKRILDGMEKRMPQLAEDIRTLMFTFEDLGRLANNGIKALLKVVPRNTLTMALRGVPPTLSELFFKNMSQSAAQMLIEDIETMGPQKLGEVQKAQREVIEWVKKLEEEGKIVYFDDDRSVV